MSEKSGRPENKSGEQPTNLPGGLPIFTTGWGTRNIQFTDEATFWDRAHRLIGESQLADSLDGAMAGHSSPRVWVFLHEPGEAHLSVAAALNFARELASRDQAVLLLDGDDEDADLTRWAGRTDLDGWIDLVRYGSSVLNCGIPMPFEGRRGYLLGVGSFTPADVTGSEVADLLGRLKRQADDILVTAPADAVGRFWAAEADLRLLCWDRSQRSASLVGNLLESFDSVGISLTGLVGFGLPKDLDDDHTPILDELVDELVDHVVDDVVVEEEGESVAESQGSTRAIFSEWDEQAEESQEEEEFARRKGNSGVFWAVAIVSLVMILLASAYYFKYLKVPSGEVFPVVTQNEVATTDGALSEDLIGGTAQSDVGLTTLQGETADDFTDQSGEQLVEDLAAHNSFEGQGQDEPAEAELVSNETLAQIDTELLSDGQAEGVEIPAAPPEFGMDPYMVPVGGAGWALHVYSFPDSLLAERERDILASKGFRSITRAVQLKDKGRWFRVYLGSFKSRNEAKAARKKLKEKLGEDWANPARF